MGKMETPKTVDLYRWSEDFMSLVTKNIDFRLSAESTNAFYFDRATWRRGFNSSISPSSPLEPNNLFGLVFYSLQYLTERDITDTIHDAWPADMLEEARKIIGMVYAKNSDYGDSALRNPILLPWLDVRCALLVRLSDKIKRATNLIDSGNSEVAESIEDTLRDIVGYVFLLWAVIKTEDAKEAESKDEDGTV